MPEPSSPTLQGANVATAALRRLLGPAAVRLEGWMGVSPSTRDPRLLLYLARHRGVVHLLRGRHFDEAFFAGHEKLRPGYAALAELVHAWAQPASVCDFGCGNAYLLSALAERGVEVAGVDGSAAALDSADPILRDRLHLRDLTRPQEMGSWELVVSTEVAEHLPRRAADTFVDTLARAARRRVFFTAARPGQWGDGHVNCRPRDYWIDLFADRGWAYDDEATARFMTDAEAQPDISGSIGWLVPNVMLFVPDAQAQDQVRRTTSNSSRNSSTPPT